MKVAGTSVEAVMDKYCLPPDGKHRVQMRRRESITEHGISTVRGYLHPGIKWADHLGVGLAKKYLDDIDPDIFKTYTKFSIVRNPWDKTVSYYHWVHPDLAMSFEEFVTDGCNIPIDRFVYCINDEMTCDVHIRYEHLLDDLKALYNKLGIPDGDKLKDIMPTYLRSIRIAAGRRPLKHYSTYYTDQSMIDKISKVYDKEIEWFGYEFENKKG